MSFVMEGCASVAHNEGHPTLMDWSCPDMHTDERTATRVQLLQDAIILKPDC